MDYALAAHLRDAGFPQQGDGKRIGPPDAIVWRGHDLAYVPTLAELIGECGEYFGSLRLNDDGSFTAYSDFIKPEAMSKYPTPDEAVGQMLLELKLRL